MHKSDLACRKAELRDARRIWEILHGEVMVMHREGRTQWQNGYPNPQVVAQDIEWQVGRVLLQEGHIVGYCALILTGETCYDNIVNGHWITHSDSSNCHYAVVHRLGIDLQLTRQGLASAFLTLLLEESRQKGCESMRIDTNHDNVQMLHILPKLGFSRCGKVMLPDGSRIAYELLLTDNVVQCKEHK